LSGWLRPAARATTNDVKVDPPAAPPPSTDPSPEPVPSPPESPPPPPPPPALPESPPALLESPPALLESPPALLESPPSSSDAVSPGGWRRLVPVASLVAGVISAVTMDRRPQRAWLVAAAAAAGWLALALFMLLDRVDHSQLSRRHARVARLAHAAASLGTQSLWQWCLFFAIPFYARAAAVPAHWAFVGVLVVAALLTLWPPLAEALLRRPLPGAGLQAASTFAGLDCMLPVLGLSTRASLWIATAVVTAGLPVSALMVRHWRQARAALAVGVALAAAMALGATRAVPPAPLRFVDGAIGTGVEARALVGASETFAELPEQLVCWTAIAAPRGLHDRLRHVWLQDGAPRGEAWLAVRGGAGARGFRTWSFHHDLGPGEWTCIVETEAGQRLGRVRARLAAPSP
jgi:uncharacterized protein DUF5924/DUF2914 family protein